MKLFQRLKRNECTECPEKTAEIARLKQRLASKGVTTYPAIMANQMQLADKIAFVDESRPWRTVTGTVIALGWTSASTFEMTLAVGWTWTDQIAPTTERPRGYHQMHYAMGATRFTLSGYKKFHLLHRINMA